jgi:ferredoxin
MIARLKYFRIVVALFIVVVFSLAFSGIPYITPGWALTEIVTFFQFVPSIMKFTALSLEVTFGFVFIIILALLVGRVYCSFLCPLGVFQDIISRIGNRFKRRKIYRFSRPNHILRYSILTIVILTLFTGSVFLLNVLDPYSIFGKMWSVLFRPVVVLINDSLSRFLENHGIYNVSPVGIRVIHGYYFIFPAIIFLTVFIMAFYRGRLFCNTVCPVGSLLGLVSKFSIFRLQINETSCTVCGKCSSSCKAECIDIKAKQIDFSRCIGCYNCLKACSEKAIDFKTIKRDSLNQEFGVTHHHPFVDFSNNSSQEQIQAVSIPNVDRRKFFRKLIGAFAFSGFVASQAEAGISSHNKSGKNFFKRNYSTTPPGSYGIEHFTTHCTACQLCVSECPSQVLQPSLREYGISGFMLPFMDFSTSFCNYECVKCTEVCPTGAILPLDGDKKKSVQIGKVVFLIRNCIVYAEETSCGACSEHCPTKAVHMVSYKGALTIPETDVNICVGCGACEYACPTEPFKAIYVEGNPVHLTAFKFKDEKAKQIIQNDFPF